MTMTPQPSLYALVPCAGSGSRAGSALAKQYVEVAGAPLVAHTLGALQAVSRLSATLVVLAPDDERFEALLPWFLGPRGWVARCGGASRAATVAAGLDALRRRGAGADDWVLVHDAARALLRPAWVDRLIDACRDDPVGGLLALPVADTLKAEGGSVPTVDAAGPAGSAGTAASAGMAAGASGSSARVLATIDRRGKWAAQTPQMFRIGLLQRALDAAGEAVTDESSAVEAMGLSPRLVAGPMENFKVTWPEDFDMARRLLAQRLASSGATGAATAPDGC
jgi:2-C-methyl-D-erythritol 4-phosphate cytidylyltransferase/2-C-methyl-D-erythritol 4-phosphate cytidylyltransferase/2-C-methyl-D-erythritol 2,4-cyclodiphosphate synthase